MTGGGTPAESLLRRPFGWKYLGAGIAIALLLAVVVFWVRAEFARSAQLRDDLLASSARRTSQIELLSQLKDLETTQRGYLLTGDPVFLLAYRKARQTVADRLPDLARARGPTIPPDYPRQVLALARAKLAQADHLVGLTGAGRIDTARAIVRSGQGRKLMDRLRAVIGAMIATETAVSEQRLRAFTEQREQLQQRMTIMYVALVLALGVALASLWRSRRQRHAALVQAVEAHHHNETILDSTIDALLILDMHGRIDRVNAATNAILGYTAAELEGRKFLAVVDLGRGGGDFRHRVGIVDGHLHRTYFGDSVARHRNGRDIAVDVTVGAMKVAGNTCFVASLRDVSERKRIDRLKDELISTVSHELRTPLTSVVGALSLLRSGGDDMSVAAPRLIEIAESNSRRLIRLINDMLDVDRIDSGKLRLARGTIDLRAVIDQACKGSEGLARSRGVSIACVAPGAPVLVAGDTDRLVQVVTNLLSNAIRVSPEGESVDLHLMVDAGGWALITVDDRGPGIPAAFRNRIFGRFERADREDGSVGAGLGLAISREIVARHEGSIWFEDRRGGGTRFAIALDRIDAGDREPTPAHILVVERHAGQSPTLCDLLRRDGHRCDVVHDAAGAVDAVQTRSYAMMLIDLDLAPTERLAMMKARHDNAAISRMPSALASRSLRGALGRPVVFDLVDWLDRPVKAERLSGALRMALHRRGGHEPVILHLDGNSELLEVVVAGLAPSAQIVTVDDLEAAREVLERGAVDIAIINLPVGSASESCLVPFPVDARGLGVPTITYADPSVYAAILADMEPVLLAAPDTIPDFSATINRIVAAGTKRRTAA